MVADVLREQYADRKILVTGEYTDNPARFPCAIIVQSSTSDYERTRTADGTEAANLMFTAYVYSNKVGYKKQEAYEIMGTIDDVMKGKLTPDGRQVRFRQTMCDNIPNLADSTIFALVARYEGVDKPEYHDEDIIHRIYIN